MKSLLKKSLASLGITAILLGTVSSVSFASIDWNSTPLLLGLVQEREPILMQSLNRKMNRTITK